MKALNYHDSGMRWAIEAHDAGLLVEIASTGFRKQPGLFPRYGHIGFDKHFRQFLAKEPEGYSFEKPEVKLDKISYSFSHEALNRLLSIAKEGCSQDLQDFLNTLKAHYKTHFSYGHSI